MTIDAKNVIKALQCRKCAGHRINNPCEENGACYYAHQIRDINGDPYFPYLCDTEKICSDALALLGPRVLTLEEVEDALDTVVWLDMPESENLADGYSLIMAYSRKNGFVMFDSPFGDNPSQDRFEYEDYGKTWRCWDKRPTDEQRGCVKWDEIQSEENHRSV